MIAWWFGYLETTEQYKWWHPQDHVWCEWKGERGTGRYIGGEHHVHEFIGGELQKLRIRFREPAEAARRHALRGSRRQRRDLRARGAPRRSGVERPSDPSGPRHRLRLRDAQPLLARRRRSARTRPDARGAHRAGPRSHRPGAAQALPRGDELPRRVPAHALRTPREVPRRPLDAADALHCRPADSHDMLWSSVFARPSRGIRPRCRLRGARSPPREENPLHFHRSRSRYWHRTLRQLHPAFAEAGCDGSARWADDAARRARRFAHRRFEEDAFVASAGLGVRRPLRFLASRLDLDDAQSAQLRSDSRAPRARTGAGGARPAPRRRRSRRCARGQRVHAREGRFGERAAFRRSAPRGGRRRRRARGSCMHCSSPSSACGSQSSCAAA